MLGCFAAKVQLEPGRDYQLTLNCPTAQGFHDVSGHFLGVEPSPIPDERVVLVLTPQINTQAVQELRRVIDEEYSYRDLRGVDWPGFFAQYSPALIQARTAAQFADVAATLLIQAKDLHITVVAGGKTFPSFIPPANSSINAALLPQLVPNYSQRSSAVWAGRFPDGIGYVLITTWMQDDIATMEAVCPTLWETAGGLGLIIDIRSNGRRQRGIGPAGRGLLYQ